ncbi:MAG: 5'-methylthioadenosine/adenosylhomocysteine nucleosidase [Aquabacterium sp.]|uniref:5'-methylthioadenosine/adenosylhomocysteine nucleosidase n=1 Tax=Aquabacterium sp. TaxID=1872578 RepID=UPI0025BA9D7E|nr:5'-methylthioadenosine/adenosylhomocysteine nucleosidase [Aquabacterium sp.]MBI5926021.1 5'-methylthioadenosine/adenosylhomocysteine nucleosidase [Aquabacterium sp.]
MSFKTGRYKGRIGIMAAMPEELQALLDVMPDEAVECVAGREFWVGHLHGREVVAVLSRIGKVAAATTTTVLLSHYGVDQIIFTGVAGGLGDGVRVGDVVVADALVQHDMDASPLFPRFELPGLGVSALSPPAAFTATVRDTVAQVLSPGALTSGGALGDVHLAPLNLGLPKVHQGLVISGDQFINAAQTCRDLTQALPTALAVEMEGAAVAQVCHDFGVPYAVIRTISDRADDDAHIDFPRFVSAVARHYSLAIVEALLQRV